MNKHGTRTIPDTHPTERNMRFTSKHPTLRLKMLVDIEEENAGRYCFISPRGEKP